MKCHITVKVVERVRENDYPKFLLNRHKEFWRHLKAKDPVKSYGCKGDADHYT